MDFVAEGENALFGAALFLVATCATESGIEFILIERGKQRLSFHQVGVHFAAVGKGTDAGAECLFIRFYDKVPAVLFGVLVAKFYHFAEFPFRIDVHQRERHFAGSKCLFCQSHHH